MNKGKKRVKKKAKKDTVEDMQKIDEEEKKKATIDMLERAMDFFIC